MINIVSYFMAILLFNCMVVILLSQGGIDICKLPVDEGPCEGDFVHYFYNSTSGACEEFIYGGCVGNMNRFSSLVECRRECRDRGEYMTPAQISVRDEAANC